MTKITLSKQQARKFVLAHQFLLPPRQLKGKEGVLSLFEQLGCIQFDSISAAGRNPDLVLQSRVTDYTPQLLQELLYKDRQLMDGWDKLASIYKTKDYPLMM